MFELKLKNVKDNASLSFSYCKFANEIDRLRGANWIITKLGYNASKAGFRFSVYLVQDAQGVGFIVTDGYALPKGSSKASAEIVQAMLKGASIADLQEIAPLKLV